MIMEKNYDPKSIEEKWYNLWLENKTFHSDHSKGGEPYCVVIPPPNVTGILHMGHALNNTIQDIMVRWRKMQGRNVVWIPGTDHAGIATQNVVERALKKEGKTREDLGRDAFIERVWEWRKEYGGTIINQLKRLGCACDWERERFTMDEGLSDAVAEVFVRLYNKGLIYKGNYIVNWCSRCQTALSDEESEHAPESGRLYYLKYEIQAADDNEKDYIVVATTRPETLLGDVAVAINPNDERYADLADRKIILPVLNRELVVIKDDFVDPDFGTGVVKVTPAHDPNDFDMGQRHNLEPINVMNGDGTMNEAAGPYEGMDRFECRKQILKDLEDAGLVEKTEEHAHSVGHCYRCDTVVEPRLSPQWFVKMKPLAEPAIEVVKNGDIEFVPARWEKVYLSWMDNIRDWCISRQIWWGHRIPVFYCDACGHQWAAKGVPDKCSKCGDAGIRQDEDVLDTWFSSWLWPFSTFGWPENNDDLKFYYPTHDLVTASEIIFFWVARMVMAGLEFMDDIPFSKVYIHGTVRDDKGLKMSKSLGNSIDPITIIDEFSADALRYSLMMITATGQDVFLSNDKFEIGRNFGTKLWNAARLMEMNGSNEEDVIVTGFGDLCEGLDSSLLGFDDKYIIDRLQVAIAECTENLEKYRFNDASHTLYEFAWHQYCDWYLEYAKNILFGDDEDRKVLVRRIMNYVFSSILRLLHPTMPFLTEELWHAMGYKGKCQLVEDSDSIMNAQWPEPISRKVLDEWGIDAESVEYVDKKHDLIRIARTLKTDYGVAASMKMNYQIKPDCDVTAERMQKDAGSLKALLRAESLLIDGGLKHDKATPCAVTELGAIYMPIEGIIDVEAEIKRLEGQLDKLNGDIERTAKKLDNIDFVSKAPQHVIDRQKTLKQDLIEKKDKVQHLLEMLSNQ